MYVSLSVWVYITITIACNRIISIHASTTRCQSTFCNGWGSMSCKQVKVFRTKCKKIVENVMIDWPPDKQFPLYGELSTTNGLKIRKRKKTDIKRAFAPFDRIHTVFVYTFCQICIFYIAHLIIRNLRICPTKHVAC